MAFPVLQVHLDDPDTGEVSWKPKNLKGARWRKARSVYQASHMADEVMPLATPDAPREIEYVGKKS